MLIQKKAMAVMSEQTAQRIGPAAELIAENAKIKGVIVLSAEDCFPDRAAQDHFYELVKSNKEADLRTAVTDAAVHFRERLTAIHPSLGGLGDTYQSLIFQHIMKDAPMALPILPDEGQPVQIGFIVLGRNHDSGAHLAQKLSGVDFQGYAGLPSHAELEQVVLFHELDHLRPESAERTKTEAFHQLAEETGRDAFALDITKGKISDHARQTFHDCRVLGTIHTTDPDHRTALGLTLLDDPHTEDAATWRSLHDLGADIHRATRKGNEGVSDILRGIFGNNADMDNLSKALGAMPLKREEGLQAVRTHIAENGHSMSSDMSRVLNTYLESHDRLEALRTSTANAEHGQGASIAAPAAARS